MTMQTRSSSPRKFPTPSPDSVHLEPPVGAGYGMGSVDERFERSQDLVSSSPANPPHLTFKDDSKRPVTHEMEDNPSNDTSGRDSESKKKPAQVRGVANLTAEQLARKRANDREAQRAIRKRTREQIESLEQQVARLSSQEPFVMMKNALRERDIALAENAEIRRRLAAVVSIVGSILDNCSSSVEPPVEELTSKTRHTASVPPHSSDGVIREHLKHNVPAPSNITYGRPPNSSHASPPTAFSQQYTHLRRPANLDVENTSASPEIPSKYAGAYRSLPISHDSALNHNDGLYQTYNANWGGEASSSPQIMPSNAGSNEGKPNLVTGYMGSLPGTERLDLHFLLQSGRESSDSPPLGVNPPAAAGSGPNHQVHATHSNPHLGATATPEPPNALSCDAPNPAPNLASQYEEAPHSDPAAMLQLMHNGK